MLLLVTFRPEFQAQWAGRPYVTSLMLNRLSEREARAMIERIIGNKSLPENIRRDVIERTDGIPLFLEEMTNAVLEAGSETAAERTIAAVPSSVREVPPTLHASLMARLDRLGRAKEVAQIGAAIGREFSLRYCLPCWRRKRQQPSTASLTLGWCSDKAHLLRPHISSSTLSCRTGRGLQYAVA